MRTLIGKGLFRVARGFRLTSHLIGSLSAIALIASPFTASSFPNWLAIAGISVGAAVAAWLILYNMLPNLLARWAVAVLPAQQMGYAATELAIWAHEARQGPADASTRSELRSSLGFDRPPNGRSGPMDFETDAQRACYETVKGWVHQLFGESVTNIEEGPQFGCPVGGFTVAVGIEPLGDDDACVDIWTWPVPNEDHLPDHLMRWMLETNARFRFGALNLQGNGAVVFEYVARADGLTKERLEALLWAVAGSAGQIQSELAPKLSA